jgi:hypothetical protein
MKTPIDLHLVIVASGLGSRLAPLTNHIPKFFVNIGKNTGYVEMIRYWSQYSTFNQDDFGSLTVVVHSQFVSLVSEYHRMYFPHIPIIIRTIDEANGSAHAILTSCSHLVGKDVLFSWCDVIPVDEIPFEAFDDMYRMSSVIFTNYCNSNRYEVVPAKAGGAFVKPVLSPTERGGCFGLYYIRNFRTENVAYELGQDFIDVLTQYGTLREHRLQKIIDFGDKPKLERARQRDDGAREFNSVEFIGDYVKKSATNSQGDGIIRREIEWYTELEILAKDKPRPSVPFTWTSPIDNSFFMTRVEGDSIWKVWPNLSPVDRHHVLMQVIEQRKALYNLRTKIVGLPTLLEDIGIEARDKLLKRYAEIQGVIDGFGKVTSVNGFELSSDPVRTIQNLATRLLSYYQDNANRTRYGFIHGDLQLSNSIVDPSTLKVSIIDPRGYFGNSEREGLEDYDAGKLLYSLSGYDTFNYSKDFHIDLVNGDIRFQIPELDLDGVTDLLESQFTTIHHGWLAVCFLGLAQYIKNDPIKSVAAHYHGMMLAQKWMMKIDA